MLSFGLKPKLMYGSTGKLICTCAESANSSIESWDRVGLGFFFSFPKLVRKA